MKYEIAHHCANSEPKFYVREKIMIEELKSGKSGGESFHKNIRVVQCFDSY